MRLLKADRDYQDRCSILTSPHSYQNSPRKASRLCLSARLSPVKSIRKLNKDSIDAIDKQSDRLSVSDIKPNSTTKVVRPVSAPPQLSLSSRHSKPFRTLRSKRSVRIVSDKDGKPPLEVRYINEWAIRRSNVEDSLRGERGFTFAKAMSTRKNIRTPGTGGTSVSPAGSRVAGGVRGVKDEATASGPVKSIRTSGTSSRSTIETKASQGGGSNESSKPCTSSRSTIETKANQGGGSNESSKPCTSSRSTIETKASQGGGSNEISKLCTSASVLKPTQSKPSPQASLQQQQHQNTLMSVHLRKQSVLSPRQKNSAGTVAFGRSTSTNKTTYGGYGKTSSSSAAAGVDCTSPRDNIARATRSIRPSATISAPRGTPAASGRSMTRGTTTLRGRGAALSSAPPPRGLTVKSRAAARKAAAAASAPLPQPPLKPTANVPPAAAKQPGVPLPPHRAAILWSDRYNPERGLIPFQLSTLKPEGKGKGRSCIGRVQGRARLPHMKLHTR